MAVIKNLSNGWNSWNKELYVKPLVSGDDQGYRTFGCRIGKGVIKRFHVDELIVFPTDV